MRVITAMVGIIYVAMKTGQKQKRISERIERMNRNIHIESKRKEKGCDRYTINCIKNGTWYNEIKLL